MKYSNAEVMNHVYKISCAGFGRSMALGGGNWSRAPLKTVGTKQTHTSEFLNRVGSPATAPKHARCRGSARTGDASILRRVRLAGSGTAFRRTGRTSG